MVKVPIGKTVKVDLWDSNKKRGMVKYHTNTMDLVRAESEFDLQKGDPAIVVESHDSFVLIVPKDKYTNLFKEGNVKNIDLKGLSQEIYNMLKDRNEETGGILSFEDLFSIFKRTSIQDIITKKLLKKAMKLKDVPFEKIRQDSIVYLALNPAEVTSDEVILLGFSKEYSFLTIDIVQSLLGWSYLRIKRMLEYFVENGRCKKDENYRTGDRYYFISTTT